MTDSLKEYFTSKELDFIQSIANNDSERNKSEDYLSLLLSTGRKAQELLQSNKLTQQN
jgi:hypothetical protein